MKKLTENPEDKIWCDKDGIAGEGKYDPDELSVLRDFRDRINDIANRHALGEAWGESLSVWVEKYINRLEIQNAALEGDVDRLRKALAWISPRDELPPDCVTVEFEFYRTFGVTEWGHGYVTTNPPLDPEWHLVANGRAEILKPYQRVERWRPL